MRSGAVCRHLGWLLHGYYMLGSPADHPSVDCARSEASQTVQHQTLRCYRMHRATRPDGSRSRKTLPADGDALRAGVREWLVADRQLNLDYQVLLRDIRVPGKAATAAGARFYSQHYRDMGFISGHSFIFDQLGKLADSVAESILKYDWSTHPIGEQKGREAALVAGESIKHRANISRAVTEVVKRDSSSAAICRYADNFNCYLADLLGMVLAANPNAVLDSDAQVPVREVLQHPDMQSIRTWLIDRKLNDLTFLGLAALEVYCKKQFGFDLLPTGQRRRDLEFIISARNLIVHKRSVIDHRFITGVGATYGAVGQRLDTSETKASELISSIVSSVQQIDEQAAQQFSLQPMAVSPDPINEMQSGFQERLMEQVRTWRGPAEGPDVK